MPATRSSTDLGCVGNLKMMNCRDRIILSAGRGQSVRIQPFPGSCFYAPRPRGPGHAPLRHLGWAADDERPDEVLDVCLFVNGIKSAQIAANMLRGDLKDPKRFGRGAHGFRYEFPPEIQE